MAGQKRLGHDLVRKQQAHVITTHRPPIGREQVQQAQASPDVRQSRTGLQLGVFTLRLVGPVQELSPSPDGKTITVGDFLRDILLEQVGGSSDLDRTS